HELFTYISRKMLYYLCWNGVPDALVVLENFGTNQKLKHSRNLDDVNKPSPKVSMDMAHIASDIFEIASKYLNDEDMLANIQRWIQESKTNFLVRSLDDRESNLGEMVDAIRHFHHMMLNSHELPIPTQKIVNVSVILGFFTDQLDFIRVAKDYIDINDMYELLKRMIFSVNSRGRLGGKTAGLFLASQILKKVSAQHEELHAIKIPKTWYITSDGILNFVLFNNLEEVMEQKYKPVELLRLEYPHIVQIFKNSPFPPETIIGLSMALDDFGDHPLIVRSSSLLEDRLGSAFSGKYKSLFLANQGTKEERLEALTDAIAEVYASTFAPDPIEYRAERGLLEFHEEMAVMIQEVVGTKIGKYFLPSYAGVAFSNNEFRWSPRIKRQDGLIRLVPGLGTRAVDRLADDYPVLIAPGQPNLRVNVTIEDNIRYAPKKIDVINLETNTFETIDADTAIKHYGDQIPGIHQMVSVLSHTQLTRPGIMTDFAQAETVLTFEGLRTTTPFVDHIHTMLNVLEERLQTPVDIEFASDGKDLYLLQCRSQSALQTNEAHPIPKDIPPDKIIFSANKFVSNGKVSDITHIVYVDPHAYSGLKDRPTLLNVGRAVSKLNKLLPKRQFILMGPGRWGSRGDIKLGVNVTYSDINNTAALIEIAMKQGNYVPELSFGTHFFQDLVEAAIFYLPIYPRTDDVVFNEHFLTTAPNMLPYLLPEYAALSETIRVIDVPQSTDNHNLVLVMNADLEKALAYLQSAAVKDKTTLFDTTRRRDSSSTRMASKLSEDCWRWRMRMATYIASQTDPERFGVEGFYVFGSTKNATAGPASDIDLLLHVRGTQQQRQELEAWLQGWSACLDEMNYEKTGYRTGGLLDVHFVTDEDIARKSSFAIKIGAMTDAARKLPMMPTASQQGNHQT
ncbi:pyruvate, phosphate dikinase, partial [candidate division KSB3 bacterium]|nr:pyruvate, phosphate dikinase [candidate division KSB3 bacterium]MBD3327334.1 pyruvate, phosphate dikinase [candidate division KSB3 bacterium]